MSLRQWIVTAATILGLLGGAAPALAHGGPVSAGRGVLILDPKAPVAGQPTTVMVKPTADDGHPLTGGTLTAEFTRPGGERVDATFGEAEPGTYKATATFAAKDWHATLHYTQGATRLVADTGFTVFADAGVTLGVPVNHGLDWRAAGITQAPTWTDTATWISLVALPVVAALALWRRDGAGATDPSVGAARSLVPNALLSLAAVAALALPVSGTWDISWHMGQGRDGLLSPPHLGIYGGIVIALLAMGVGAFKAGGVSGLKQSPALVFSMAAMLVQLASAPLDEVWHRVMGVDISVWAPPHDMLIFGGAFWMLGLAAIQAVQDPEHRFRATRLRIVAFGAAALLTMMTFLAEFEFPLIPAWHVSQTRPAALFPTLAALNLAVTLGAVARLGRGKWLATQAAALFYALRVVETVWLLPALHRTVPHLPPLALLLGALVIDLVVQWAPVQGRYRYGLAGAAGAAALFLGYTPLSGVVPVKAIPALDLLLWAVPAIALAGAGGYLAGWLGDLVLTSRPQPYHHGFLGRSFAGYARIDTHR